MNKQPDQPAIAGVEHELKFSVPPEFEIPDLAYLVPGSELNEVADLQLDATYFDTADLRLARRNVTLRRRTGEGHPRWTLKFPKAQQDVLAAAAVGARMTPSREMIVRREIDVEDSTLEPPGGLVALVTGFVRSSELVPVARLISRRRRMQLVDKDGLVLVEIDDDEVSAINDGRVVAMFREVELEFADNSPVGLVERLGEGMRVAGAESPDPMPKLVRVLGERARARPDFMIPELDSHAMVADLFRAAVVRSTFQLIDVDHIIRLDGGLLALAIAMEAVDFFRATLSMFNQFVDRTWADEFGQDLEWLGAAVEASLGAELVLGLLRGAFADFGSKIPTEARSQMLGWFEHDRMSTFDSLLSVISTKRYVDFLDSTVEASGGLVVDPAVESPADEIVAGIVRNWWRRMQAAVDALGPTSNDRDFHEVRIALKHLKCAAEIATPIIGGGNPAIVASLGELHSAAADVEYSLGVPTRMRSLAQSLGGIESESIHDLVAMGDASASAYRVKWFQTWQQCSRDLSDGWLS